MKRQQLPVNLLLLGGSILVSFALTGCGRGDVEVYNVPKETGANPHMTTPGMPAGHPTMGAMARPGVKWQLPEGWEEGQPSTMRAASFRVPSQSGLPADVAVIPLPPGGNDLDLVNMWRGEVQLPPTTAAAAARDEAPVSIGGDSGKLYEMASTDPGPDNQRLRILVAMLERDGLNWFFKMKGEDAHVRNQKSNFLAFLKSIEFTAAPAAMAASPHGGPAGARPAAAAHNDGKPHWNVPAGWQEVPGGQFLVAKFNLPAEAGASAAVNVGVSGGSWLINVNRWRQQLGLSSANEAELAGMTSHLETAGGRASVSDFTGTDAQTSQPSRSIGIMVPQPGQPWFYRLVGSPAVVEREKDAFMKFVQTVDYSHAH